MLSDYHLKDSTVCNQEHRNFTHKVHIIIIIIIITIINIKFIWTNTVSVCHNFISIKVRGICNGNLLKDAQY